MVCIGVVSLDGSGLDVTGYRREVVSSLLFGRERWLVGENNITHLNASESKIFTKRHLRLHLEKLNLRL
jgi:hypothetical protein